MIHKCIALVVPYRLSEAVTAGSLDVRHSTLEVLLNGGLECIVRGDWHVYLNADSRNLRPNLRAAQLLHASGLDLPVAGKAIFLGRADHDGDTDTPAHLIRLAERLFETRLAAAELV